MALTEYHKRYVTDALPVSCDRSDGKQSGDSTCRVTLPSFLVRAQTIDRFFYYSCFILFLVRFEHNLFATVFRNEEKIVIVLFLIIDSLYTYLGFSVIRRTVFQENPVFG